MKLWWSTKTNKNKNLKTASFPNKPDCLMTTHLDIDFVNVSNTTLSSSEPTESLQVQTTHSCKLIDCQVVLDDVFSTNSTETFKMLETNQDKTHVSSQWCLDKHYLEQLIKKSQLLGLE